MEIISYNHELEYANLLFSKLFRNIKIQKFYKNTLTEVPVNCMIGNRWRIFKNMENPEKLATYTFPLIAISRRGIQVEPARIANLHNEVKWFSNPDNPYYYDLMTPVPVAISYDVTIISKDQATNDMIMSNFIPFFNQDLFVSSIHPKFTNVVFNNQVIMSNSITEEHPDELNASEDDFVINTCNFTFKTYLFGGKAKATAGRNSGLDGGGSGGGSGGGGSGPGGDGDLYDGFVPIIKSIHLDMHAVPYKDPTEPNKYIWQYVEMPVWRKTGTGISAEYVYDKDGHKILDGFKTLSVLVKNPNYDPYLGYTITKYFKDVDAGMLPQDVDTLRWYIDESQNRFKLDRFTKYVLSNTPSGLTSVPSTDLPSTYVISTNIDYPGEMWENGKDPFLGFKNDISSASDYVPIVKY